MRIHSVLTSSGSLAYREAGTGPVLVLLHAFPFDSEMWAPQLQAFAKRFRVLALDVPGLGGSPGSVDLSIDQIATCVRDLLDALKIGEPIVLGGLSMGGYTALAFARRFPERLRGLILADTKADPDDDAARFGRDKMIELVEKEGVRPVIEQLIPKLLGTHTRNEKPEVVKQVLDIAGRQPTAGVKSALKALRDRPDATPTLAKIAVPTLVIVGEEDGVTPPSKAKVLREGIANATLVTIPGVGHLSSLEDSHAFNSAIDEFLTSLNVRT